MKGNSTPGCYALPILKNMWSFVQQSVSTVRSEAFKHYVYTTPVVWLLVLVSWVIGHGFDTIYANIILFHLINKFVFNIWSGKYFRRCCHVSHHKRSFQINKCPFGLNFEDLLINQIRLSTWNNHIYLLLLNAWST
jgi:hypothetical protein